VQGIHEDQDRENKGKAWIYHINKKGAMTTCVTLHHGVKWVLKNVAKAVESGGVVQELCCNVPPKMQGRKWKKSCILGETLHVFSGRCMIQSLLKLNFGSTFKPNISLSSTDNFF
jgi:hypothetical protein